MQKEEDLHIRIRKKLKEKVRTQSKKANLSMSEYVDKILSNRNITVIEEGMKIYYELNRIGNNVNQIAKKVNSGIATNKDMEKLDDVARSLKGIWQLLNSLMSK